MGSQYTDFLERSIEDLQNEIFDLKKLLTCPCGFREASIYCSAGSCYDCLLRKARE